MFLNALLLTGVNSYCSTASLKVSYLLLKKHIRPLYHLILLCCFISLVLSVFFRSARVTGLALCWSLEIDNAPETRNKNAARGRDTRIPYYANTGVILKTNRCLLFPYISVSYVSVSPENKTFNVSSPMMDLTFNHCSEWKGFIWREENKMQEIRHQYS